jgi:hypothetical protein
VTDAEPYGAPEAPEAGPAGSLSRSMATAPTREGQTCKTLSLSSRRPPIPDPLQFVLEKNLNRRHLTESQSYDVGEIHRRALRRQLASAIKRIKRVEYFQ